MNLGGPSIICPQKLLVPAIAFLIVSGFAGANPTAPTVVSGQVSIQQNGNVLQVTGSPNAISNWQSFSVGANQLAQFVQQSASSAMLNRVVGIDPTLILGTLQSNGGVVLLNSSGILFGAGVHVDAAGLVVSSLNLSNADFLAGAYQFSPVPAAGNILNQGAITIGSNGLTLAAPEIINTGLLQVSGGGAIVLHGNLVNDGEIRAEGGSIAVYNGTVSGNGSYFGDSIFFGGLNTGGDPAIINVGDLAVFSGSSNIEIHLGGTAPGVDFDEIVAGTIVLQGGTLTLTTLNGFVPQAGDEFDILGWITLTGTFGSLVLPTLSSNLSWDTSGLYVNGTISVAAAPEPGSLALLSLGLAGLGFARRAIKKR